MLLHGMFKHFTKPARLVTTATWVLTALEINGSYQDRSFGHPDQNSSPILPLGLACLRQDGKALFDHRSLSAADSPRLGGYPRISTAAEA